MKIVIIEALPIEEESHCKDSSLACFAEDLAMKSITSGVKAEWFLPTIIEGKAALKLVTISPDSILLNYVSFDQSTSKISYNGEKIQGISTKRKFVKIEITLTDLQGQE